MEPPTKKPKTKSVSIKTPLQPKASTSSVSRLVKKAAHKSETQPSQALGREHDATLTSALKSKNTESKPQMPRRLVVVSGSYDKILYGLQIEPTSKDPGETPQFKPIFVFPAHISCVKAVAASPQGGRWLASGGTDEIIKVWDLRRKKELGSLQQHQG
jgi:protein MAK11